MKKIILLSILCFMCMGVGAYEPESVNPSQNLKVSRNLKYIDIEGTKIYDVTIMLQSISPDYFFYY